jgi:hypothetical protein
MRAVYWLERECNYATTPTRAFKQGPFRLVCNHDAVKGFGRDFIIMRGLIDNRD